MSDGDFNLATLWLPVAPETSKIGPALEEAGQQGKKKFSDSVKGIGDTIHDDLSKAGTKAKDAFSGLGRNITDILSKSGRDGGRALTDSLNTATKSIDSGPIRALVDTTNNANTSVRNLGRSFVDLRSGDVSGALDRANDSIQKINDSAKKVGLDLSEWTTPLSEDDGLLSKASDTSNQLADHLKNAKDGVERLGNSGGGLSGLIGKLGEVGAIASAVVGAFDVLKNSDQWLQKKFEWYHDLQKTSSDSGYSNFWRDIDKNFLGFDPGNNIVPGKPTATTDSDGNPLFHSGITAPGSDTPLPPSGPQVPWNFQGPLPPGTTRGPKPPDPNFYKNWYPPASESGTDWDAISQGESSGDWEANTGNGFYGGLQFTQSTWEEYGGLKYAPRADLATARQQKIIAERVLKGQGPKAWPNTYKLGAPGRNSPSGLLSSSDGDFGASAGNPTIAPPDENSIRQWVAENFGIPNTFGTGSWENRAHNHDGGWHHRGLGGKDVDSGYAFDFHGTPDQMAGLANWVADNFKDQTLELIYGGKGFDHNREIKNAKYGDVYGAGLNAEHTDHVHWAMTQAPYAMARGGGSMGSGQIPIGTQHDPIYVSNADTGSGSSGSPFEQQGKDLGQGLVNGVLQMFGLDGSVFGGKSPLDWTAVKAGGGILNWGMGVAKQRAAYAEAGGTFGGGGGGFGALGGMAGLIPSPGAMISAAAQPAGGSRGIGSAIGDNGAKHITYDMSTKVENNNFRDKNALIQSVQEQQNSRLHTVSGGLPAPSVGSP